MEKDDVEQYIDEKDDVQPERSEEKMLLNRRVLMKDIWSMSLESREKI